MLATIGRNSIACFVVAASCGGLAAPALSAEPRSSASAPRAASAETPTTAVETGAEQIPGKVRRYAQRLLERYDKNGDGKLQRVEWSKMHGSPQAADANGDGVITLDELVNFIAAFGRNRHIGSAGPIAGSTHSDQATSPAGEAPKRSTTFYVPQSRLPPGLPEWFLRRDVNGDGQLSLAEFAPHPTQADLDEFARYDLNGDGFITARECLAVLNPATPPARKAAAGPAGASGGKASRKKAADGNARALAKKSRAK